MTAQHVDADTAPRRLVYRRLHDLKPDPRNPKAHSIEQLRASLGRFGYVEPIVEDDRTGRLISGHGRRELLLDDQSRDRDRIPDGLLRDTDGEWLVPVNVGWSSANDDEAYAYLVAANALVEAGGWVRDKLADALAHIAATARGLDGIGYTREQLDRLLVDVRKAQRDADTRAADAARDPNEIPEQAEAVTAPGDVWLLGRHRLVCGDSTDPAVVEAACAGRPADLVFTSPPYNIGVEYADRREDSERQSWDDYAAMLGAVIVSTVAVLGRGRALCWNIGAAPVTRHGEHLALLERSGLDHYRTLVWRKVGVVVPMFHMTRRSGRARVFTPNPSFELVYVFTTGNLEPGGTTSFGDLLEHDVFTVNQALATRDLPADETANRTGSATQQNLSRRSRKAHPAPFPVELPQAFIEHLTAAGETVLDPFAGAASTIIAAERTDRAGVGVELTPGYVDVACQRFERLTGVVPVLESSGQPRSFLPT